MRYSKEDAQMTQGLAVLCMVILHLFCRTGDSVLGTPLIWLDPATPLVYWFGFFAEICVPIYSICTGYAQQLLWENGRSGFRSRAGRILRLMRNYWIILILFSVLGLIFDNGNAIPGSLGQFLRSLVLLYSYNGAWWYLNTYVILLVLPPAVLLLPVHKMKLTPGLLFCAAFHVLWYLVNKFGFVPDAASAPAALQFLRKELVNLFGILSYIWAGGLLCKYRAIEKLWDWFGQTIPAKGRKAVLLLAAICGFVAVNIIHKAVLMGFAALAVFVLFNLWEKGQHTRKAMLFLGRHSTNIWLVHMFFYSGFLRGPVLAARYPILMLSALLALSICSSYVIMQIDRWVQWGIARIQEPLKIR